MGLNSSLFSYNEIGDAMKKLIVGMICFLIMPFHVLAVSTSATSAILLDQDSNRILYQHNIHAVRSVASISKIMTAILAVESGKLDKKLTINEVVKRAYGSGIYVKVGEKLTLKDLVYGLMLRSGNDAALAIADYVGKDVDDFVKMMNQKAKEIGMKNTTFHNPSGLDEDKEVGNYSTAYDMAILMRYAMQNETFREIVGTKKYQLKTNMNHYIWYNKNKLLNTYEYTTGGKTGFTKKARRTLVSSATKDHMNLIAVTLNDGNDFQDHKNLHEYGFQTYESYLVLKKDEVHITEENYYKGEKLYLKNDIKIVLQKSEKDAVHIKYKLEKKNEYKNKDQVGVVELYLGEEKLSEFPILIESKPSKKVYKKSIWEKVKGWFLK